MALGMFNKTSGHRRTQGAGSFVSGCLFLVICSCHCPGQPNPAKRPVPADQILDFQVLYQQNCSGCHGARGKLGPAPPLNDAIFRTIVPKETLDDIVTNGRHNTLMPAFAREQGGTLTSQQIQVLVHEIKGIPYRLVTRSDNSIAKADVVADDSGIAPTWGPPGDPPPGVPSYSQPSTSVNGHSTGNLRTGADVFVRACAACHGENGRGVQRGSTIVHTINDSVLLNLNSDQVLRRYAITGRPDLGMPSFGDSRPGDPHFKALTEQDVTDLVTLLTSWRQTTFIDK